MDQVNGATLVRGADGVLYEISAASCQAVRATHASPQRVLPDVHGVHHAGHSDYTSARLTIDPSDDYASSRLTIEADADYASSRLTIDPSDDYASSRLTIEADADYASSRLTIDPSDDYASSRLTIEPEVLAQGRPVFTVDPRLV